MVEKRGLAEKSEHSLNIRKPGKRVAWTFIYLSILCLIDYAVFSHGHGKIPLWIGAGFSMVALLVIILNKCSGLRFALLLATFFVCFPVLALVTRLLSTDLEGAVVSGDIWRIKRSIAKGADVNSMDWNGQTMLTAACRYWRIGDRGIKDFERQQTRICKMVEILIDNGADVNRLDDLLNEAPLHVAVERKMYRVVEMLLAKGADPNLKDRNGNTPLHFAVSYGLDLYDTKKGIRDIMELLIKNGADVNAQNNERMTPLELAEKEGLGGFRGSGGYKGIMELLRK